MTARQALRDGDTVYKKCEEVSHLLGDHVRVGSSCPGRTTDEEHVHGR